MIRKKSTTKIQDTAVDTQDTHAVTYTHKIQGTLEKQYGFARKMAEGTLYAIIQMHTMELKRLATKEDISVLTGRVDKLEARIGNLEARMGNLEARMGNLEARMGNLEARMGNLEARIGNLETRVGNLETHVGNLEMRIVELKESILQQMKILMWGIGIGFGVIAILLVTS